MNKRVNSEHPSDACCFLFFTPLPQTTPLSKVTEVISLAMTSFGFAGAFTFFAKLKNHGRVDILTVFLVLIPESV